MAVSYMPKHCPNRPYKARAILRLGPVWAKKVKKEVFLGYFKTRGEAEKAVSDYLSKRQVAC